MQSYGYHPSDMDGASIATPSFSAPGKTGLRQRGRGTQLPHSATVGRTREPSHHQLAPPPFIHPSASSSEGGGGGVRRHEWRGRGGGTRSSATWTSSSDGGGGGGCDLANLSDTDEVQDRRAFVAEYNRLAGKHGIRLLVPDDHGPSSADHSPHHRHSQHKRTGWFSRTFLRQPSTCSNASGGSTVIRASNARRPSHKRSVSDLAIQIIQPILKRDSLKGEDLQSLVRLCGKSILYLPSEYAPGSLVLPTCFRATAQYLVQHAADTRGVFRIPGSVRVVSELYEFYCAEGNVAEITSTIRCPNLPQHIKVTTHDVASTFKRLLSGLPGGILGSLPLLDALVAIHSQLKGDPELTKTKQTKLRARLIALAIGSVKSQFRRELICAVFGLLCLIGRAAETAPREDEHGRPLPTADLMGYSALGIVFGPLLVSDLLNSYSMRLAHPSVGLVLFPITPPHVRREKRKSRAPSGDESSQAGSLSVDKIHVANSITEMLVTHWRDVVKHMKNLDILRACAKEGIHTGIFQDHNPEAEVAARNAALRPSASESFVIRKPAEWSAHRPPRPSTSIPKFPHDMSESPIPPSPTPDARRGSSGGSRGRMFGNKENNSRSSSLQIQRQRPKVGVRSSSTNRVAPKASLTMLSPTAEEPAALCDFETSPSGIAYVTEGGRQNGYNVPPTLYYTAPMQVPPNRSPQPEDQSEGGMRGRSYRDDDSTSIGVDNDIIHPGDRPSEEVRTKAWILGQHEPRRRLQASESPLRFRNDTTEHQIRRRAYSQISARGEDRNALRSFIPEPTPPRTDRGSLRGGQAKSSIPKPANTYVADNSDTIQEGQAVQSVPEQNWKHRNGRSSFRLRKLSNAGGEQQDEAGEPPKEPDNSGLRPRPQHRLTKRSLKGSQSSRSSYASEARPSGRALGQVDPHVRAVAGESSEQHKNSIFPHWKQRHLSRSGRSSEAGEVPNESNNMHHPLPPKSKMRLSFHLRKSASESGAGGQERRRPPRSAGETQSHDHVSNQQDHEQDEVHPSPVVTRGRGRSSRTRNESSGFGGPPSKLPVASPVEPGRRQSGGVRRSLGISDNTSTAAMSSSRGQRSSNIGEATTSPGPPKGHPTTPSRIPLPHGQVRSGTRQLRGDTKGKGRESTASEDVVNTLHISPESGPMHAENETASQASGGVKDNESVVSRAPTTPPPRLNRDLSRVQTPTIPVRTSSVNRHTKSSAGRTPYPAAMLNPVPMTPNMDSPTRQPRRPTGSSVKAMAAMFESNNPNNISPSKPPVPVFGIPTPIMQQKQPHEGVDQPGDHILRKKLGSNNSLVGEYTVNSMSPSRSPRKQGAGIGLMERKSFSLSPIKRSPAPGSRVSRSTDAKRSTDSARSTEDKSEKSWVTVVPFALGSSSRSPHPRGVRGATEGGGGHGDGDVESENVAIHPAWKDSDISRVSKEKSKDNTNGEDGSEQTHGRLDEDGDSVQIMRPHVASQDERGSSVPGSEGSELGEPSNVRRIIRSVVSRGRQPQRQVVAMVTTPTRLGRTATGLRTSIKGDVAQPAVDLSTAVASATYSRSQSQSVDRASNRDLYQARVDSDVERPSSEIRMREMADDQKEGDQQQDEHGSFLPPVRFVTFSDIDVESQKSRPRSGQSTPRVEGYQGRSGRSSKFDDGPTGSTSNRASSPAAMEVPYSAIQRPHSRTTERLSSPLRVTTDLARSSTATTSRKTTGESSSSVPSYASPKTVRASASNLALHVQIRNLQRQLDHRTEEVRHLRRLLDTKENPRRSTDIVTLTEKLGQTERECRMWRERAEAAERRVAMFERITARVRSRRLGAGVGGSEKRDGGEGEGQGQGGSVSGGQGEIQCEGKDVKEGKDKRKEKEEFWERRLRNESNDMHTEDEGTFVERMRSTILGGMRMRAEGDVGHDRGVGPGMDGGYEFEGEDDVGEGVWLDIGSEDGGEEEEDEFYDEGGVDEGVDGDGEYEYPHQSTSTLPGYGHAQDHSPFLEPRLSSRGSRASHGHHQKSASSNYYAHYFSNESDVDVEKGDGAGLDDETDGVAEGVVDVGIDNDNRSSTTVSTTNTGTGIARTPGRSGLSGHDERGERLSASSAAGMWIRAVDREEFVYSDEREGDGDGEGGG